MAGDDGAWTAISDSAHTYWKLTKDRHRRADDQQISKRRMVRTSPPAFCQPWPNAGSDGGAATAHVGLGGLGYTDGMADLYQKFVEKFECHT